MDLGGLPADQAARWQWLADYFYHFDDCMDELKDEVKAFALWKKSVERSGVVLSVVKVEIRAAIAGAGVAGTVFGILRALGVV